MVAALFIAFVATVTVFLLDNITDGPDMDRIALNAGGDLQRHIDSLLRVPASSGSDEVVQ